VSPKKGNFYTFELSKEEYQFLRSQSGTLKRGTHSKYAPMAFTEQLISFSDKRGNKIGYIKENQANYDKGSRKN